MNLRRVAVLLAKELKYGSRSFLFVFAVVMPIVVSLVISLIFGKFSTGKPKLGIVDEGNSQLTTQFVETDYIRGEEYDSAAALREAVEVGAVDVGLVIPANFDQQFVEGLQTSLNVYVWGESLLKNRAVLSAAMAEGIVALAGREVPVMINSTTVGEGEGLAWDERLLPLIVLMSIILGGSMVPATSIVEERMKRTLGALTITPMSLSEVFLSKALLGILVSVGMAVIVLVLNQAFGGQPLLFVSVLLLGAMLAAAFGLLLGAATKDINTLFAVIKGTGLFLYAPAILELFPSVPGWIAKLFPTYYIINPILQITQQGAGLGDIVLDVGILMGLIVAMFVGVIFMTRRLQQMEL